MLYSPYLGVLLCAVGSFALYDSSSDVVDLNPNNFDKLVTNSDEVWIVEFYAPWCGHCKNLVPEYKKAARALKGIVKVGAVNADDHKSLSQKYGVTGFPTIKIFMGSKHSPYQGQRTAEAFVDAAIKAAKERAYSNLGKKAGGSSSSDKNMWTKVYGHKIPWIQVKTTNALKQISQPDLTSPLSKLDVLQSQLFRRRFADEQPPKIIYRRYFTKKGIWKRNKNKRRAN